MNSEDTAVLVRSVKCVH